MSEGYEEDLGVYQQALRPLTDQLDAQSLLIPISNLTYSKTPLCVEPDATVQQALESMVQKRTTAVLVLERGGVAGIFAERDVVIKRLYDGKRLQRAVRDFMTPDPRCLSPHDSVALALNCMAQGGYRHVPLIDTEGAPVGMLRVRDVIDYLVSFFPLEVLNLPPHSEYNPPDRRPVGG